MDMTEKFISTDYKFKGRIINLRVDDVELPDGHKSTREVVEHGGGVGIIAIDDEGRVAAVRQYRTPYKEIIYEIPAGKLESGEDPLVCGQRELREETGYSAKNWTFLGNVYPSPGYCAEIIRVFLATGLTAGEAQPDEGEFIEAEFIPLDKMVEMVMTDEIKDAKTQVAVLKAAILRERNEL